MKFFKCFEALIMDGGIAGSSGFIQLLNDFVPEIKDIFSNIFLSRMGGKCFIEIIERVIFVFNFKLTTNGKGLGFQLL